MPPVSLSARSVPLVDWTRGVAARLTALALDPRGRPVVQLLAADAVRCGLLVDLAFAGRIAQARDSVHIDTTPTSFPPADVLLAEVAFGTWRERRTLLDRRRYAVTDRTRVDLDKHLDITSAASTCAHLVGEFRHLGCIVPAADIPAEVFRAAGDHVWVLAAGVEHLRTMRYRYLYGRSALFGGPR